MSLFDKIKDAMTPDKYKEAADQAAAKDVAEAAKEAAERIAAQQRDEAEAREAADRDAEAAANAQEPDASIVIEEPQPEVAGEVDAQPLPEAPPAEEVAHIEETPARPVLSVGRVREVVAHDSNPNTPTGQGLDHGVGMLLESALRRALDQVGLPNRNTDDGALGTMFLESYSRWQGHLGYSGNDADGVPGRATLQKLAEATGMFDVVD